MAKKIKGGESLPLARTSSLATPSPRGKAPKTPEVSREFCETKLDSERKRTNNVPGSAPIEAPYELPEGWKWEKGESLFKPMESTLPKGDYFSYIDIESIDNTNQTVFSPKQLPCKNAPSRASRKLHAGDTVFSMVRPYLKNIAYIDSSLADSIASTGFFVCTPRESVDGRYVYNLMKSPYVVDGLNALMKGDNSPSIRKSDIEGFHFPLPPTLAEQQRIVNRIETMFAKLDQAQEKAQSVLDSFETRKAAILHKAFTGELTAKWCKENGVADESWEEKTIGECFTHTTGKALKRDNQNGTLREYITTSNLYWDRFDFSEVRTMYFTDDELEKCTAKKGDLLLCNGGDVGRAAIWNFDYDICLQNHVSKLRNKGSVETRLFLYYFMLSKIKGNVNGKGIGISSLSAKDLLAMSINLPSLPEQQEIVRILDTVLEKESRAKEAAQTVLDQIALLKKSILARAFRGKL